MRSARGANLPSMCNLLAMTSNQFLSFVGSVALYSAYQRRINPRAQTQKESQAARLPAGVVKEEGLDSRSRRVRNVKRGMPHDR